MLATIASPNADRSHRPPRAALSRVALLLAALASLAAPAARAGILEGSCRVGNQPAATLLIPYFEVDLDDPSGRNTLFSVNNASSRATLARVVLWTEWGIPTLAFDIYLTGYDVQTLNVRDLFQGALPKSGPEVSHAGLLSEPGPAPPECGGVTGGGVAPPLAEGERRMLRAAHTGQPLADGPEPMCASQGAPSLASFASGYITVDTVRRCSPRTVDTLANTPAHALYFASDGTGLATDNNALWGDYFYVYPSQEAADSQTAIAIPADPDFFHAGDYTFYGRYVGYDARDHRAPLSSLYYTRFVDGGSFGGGTDLIVWRDTRRPDAAPVACGRHPAWSPPGELQIVAFDEEENPTELRGLDAFPLATQRVHVGGPSLPVTQPFGWLMLDLWFRDATHAQGWVSVIMSAGGRFSNGHEALRVDDLCNFGL